MRTGDGGRSGSGSPSLGRMLAVALQEKRLVFVHDVERRAVAHHACRDRARACGGRSRDVVERVRAEEDRLPLLLELADLVDALLLKVAVADRQRLVDDEDVGIDVDGDRERQPHVHAGRVRLHRPVEERAELGELQDRRQPLLHLGGREPEDGGVERGVVAAGELGMEAGAELEDRGDRAVRLERAAGRPRDAAEKLEQRALAGAVLADDADRLAALDFERDVLQRRERPCGAAAA